MPYKVLDLFAGAGGLSLGFKQTGKFIITDAAEKNSNAKKTYEHNFPETVLHTDVHDINYQELKEKRGGIDIIVGGPPCQGFSNANRQHTTLISSNNQLVKEFVRAVIEINPEAFVMENVAMLKSEVHRFILSEGDSKDPIISKLPLKNDSLELFPSDIESEGILDFAKNISNIEKYGWNAKYYSVLNILYKKRLDSEKFNAAFKRHNKQLSDWANNIQKTQSAENGLLEKLQVDLANELLTYSGEKGSDTKQLISLIETPLFVQRLLGKIKELEDNNIQYQIDTNEKKAVVAKVRTYSVSDYITGILGEKSQFKYKLYPMILNAADYGAPQKRERVVIVGVKPGYEYTEPQKTVEPKNYRTIAQAIKDLEKIPVTTNVDEDPQTYNNSVKISVLAKELRNGAKELSNHVTTKTGEIAQERFNSLKEGENFHNLDNSLKTTYSNAERTQNTIYLKLKYDEPSGTVVNVRKSMWIHPTLNRAISIREAARLQTFPDTFVFKGSKDSQYQQVGNAVPPFLAKAIAESVALALQSKSKKKD